MTGLDGTTWPEVERQAQRPGPLLLVVPVGSCEQHGPHLPFDVDTCVAEEVARSVAAGTEQRLLGPPLGYGASGEHQGFPGTVSVGTEVLRLVLLELGRSATCWADRVLFVSAHGGNAAALVAASTLLRREGRDVAWWPCAVPGADAHAGRTETSLLLALRPGQVRVERAAPGRCEPVAALLPELRAAGVLAVSPSGVLGDPTGASADEGLAVLADLNRRAAQDVCAWQVAADGRLLPASAVR